MEFWTSLNTELMRWLCKLNKAVPLKVLDLVLVMLVGVGLWKKVSEGEVSCCDDCGCGGNDGNDGGDCGDNGMAVMV